MSQDLIVKDNRLITAKYHLTTTQIKFISFLSTKIQKDDKSFFTYTFNVNEILKVLDIERTNYKLLRVSLRQLMTKYIVIEDNEYIISETTFLSHFQIDKKADTIEIKFDNSLRPFLLELSERFTKLSLSKILQFNSQYTIRMYEIIESRVNIFEKYKNKKLLEFEYKIEEIKEILLGDYNGKDEELKIPKAYQKYNNFKRKVLDIAFKELKDKGDYYFEYQPIKTSRSYTSIKFTIFKNGEKIKKDFHEKKKQILQNSTTKALAQEQIRRIIERKKDTIKDKLKYEQKLFQLYLKGELKFDKDLEAIRQELENKEIRELLG